MTVSGTSVLGGSGTVGGRVAINSGGTITGGTLGTVGTLTVGSLSFNGGTFAADFNGNTSDTLATAGTVNLNAGSCRCAFTVNSPEQHRHGRDGLHPDRQHRLERAPAIRR